MCSETTPLCPSFSYDLSEQVTKHNVPRKDTFFMDSNPEFEFSTSISLGFESSSADELFYNGVILPIQVQQESTNTSKHTRYGESPYAKLPPRPCVPRVDKMKKKESTREVIDEKKIQSKSFWGFSRSRSLNCDTNKNLVTSIPLARSKSIGSALNPKRMSSNRHISASSSQSSIINLYPLQKSSSGKSYTNGLRISPVLNVPTPCISKGGASLFMLGSFLRVGKVKKSKI
ncbi:hypothetical protein TanjilG_32802 [Lupinus angustifolius]|uniref:Uncharacterized protein n=1 Tax=Lupinus angustifolius TaxID=3871 RepID=A0A4P1RFI3_LUPAN|nr:PREDICTED: uncharacterized protein LOC109349759 [Lupinus angustifolius]OIW10062.1 hypothetical protein TanjilG_32802 [Lupinus angustifolius]